MSELTPALLWLIPGAPLLASVLIAFFGKAFLRGRSHVPCVGALVVSTLIAGFLNLMFLAAPGSLKPDPATQTGHNLVTLDADHSHAVASHGGPKPLLTTPGYVWSVTDNLQVRIDLQSSRSRRFCLRESILRRQIRVGGHLVVCLGDSSISECEIRVQLDRLLITFDCLFNVVLCPPGKVITPLKVKLISLVVVGVLFRDSCFITRKSQL